LALHQQHPGIHAKRAVAVECDHRAFGAERDAGGKHRGEAHRRFEVKHPLGLMRDLPPQFRAVARRGDDDLFLQPRGKEPEAGFEIHLKPLLSRLRA
jgi:hypothetical protein